MAGIWTEERKQKARERILQNKPWEKSTGPKTPEGKAKSSLNSFKHGKQSEHFKEIDKLLEFNRQTVAAHMLFTAQSLYIRQRQENGDHHLNELISKMNKNKDLNNDTPHPPVTAK